MRASHSLAPFILSFSLLLVAKSSPSHVLASHERADIPYNYLPKSYSDTMAISIWKCMKRRDGRMRFQQRAQNLQPKIPTKCARYENSYRMESYKPFRPDPVDEVIKTMMENRLEDIIYDTATSPKLCNEIAADIRKKIMKLQFNRYKLVVVVTMIEKASQSLKTNVGFLWDVDRDNYSTHIYETQTFYAYCYVFATYYE